MSFVLKQLDFTHSVILKQPRVCCMRCMLQEMVTAKRGQSRGVRPDSTSLSQPYIKARQDLAMQLLIIIDQMLSNISVESHYTITCVMSSFDAHPLLVRHFKFVCFTSTSCLNKIACKPFRLDRRPMRTKR